MASGKRNADLPAGQSRFMTTAWTHILACRTVDSSRRQDATAEVLRQYWRPIYTWLRRKGYDANEAQDLTQGFLTDVVLGRSLPAKAHPERGRFRTFLLTALGKYIRDEHRKASAQKRSPAEGLVALEALEDGTDWEPADDCDPAEAFNRSWVHVLLEDTIQEVREACGSLGQEDYFQAFSKRVLLPCLEGHAPVGLEKIRDELGARSAKAVSNMIVTMKRRFSSALRRRVRQWVQNDEDVEKEIAELLLLVAGNSAAGRDLSRIHP